MQVNNIDYYVPVTSYTQQKPDNFLIRADNGQVASSLRFNYMFPIPKELVAERTIAGEPDRAYRALLAQELKYCINNQPISTTTPINPFPNVDKSHRVRRL